MTSGATEPSRSEGRSEGRVEGRVGSRGRLALALETRPDELGAYNGELLFGVVSEANAHGYEVGVWTSAQGAGRGLGPRLAPGAIDGAVVVGAVTSDPWLTDLTAAGIPMAVLGRWSGVEGRVHCVDTDHEHGTEVLLGHLAGLGRRRIAVVTGPLDVPDAILRLHTYERLRVELDLDPDPGLVVGGDFSAASGEAAMEQLLTAAGGVPDAVFAMNDAMAAGVIHAARRAGLRVPHDVAVVGFDAVIDPLLLPMSLTTARQNIPELGRRGVRALLDLIAGAAGGEIELVPAELVLGESTMGAALAERHPRRHLAPVRD